MTCSHCGAVHKVSWYRLPVREPYQLDCRKCRETLASGKGVRAYEQVLLIKT